MTKFLLNYFGGKYHSNKGIALNINSLPYTREEIVRISGEDASNHADASINIDHELGNSCWGIIAKTQMHFATITQSI